ncbi:MAG: lipocalin-like domain-containing protein [Prevotellaceae bacterium]|nr:lipocalin-like domain-containing protein [Prevotellaceae bacterium]MDY6130289.1 lipocalin-like domain-containing protein [Prevotella sp.]
MKKITFFISLLCTIFVSCELETSRNGDIEGAWLLTKIDTLKTSGTQDMRSRSILWSVQYNLLSIREESTEFLFHFKYENDTITLLDAYNAYHEEWDRVVEDPSILAPFGVHELNERFKVANIHSDKMILETKDYRLKFQRY